MNIEKLHKMGRLTLNLVTIVGTFICLLLGKDITPTAAAVLTGGNIAYQLIKGKGTNTQ